MRSERMATCTSGEPVSPAFVPYSFINSCLRSVVIDIGHPRNLVGDGPITAVGQIEHALGIESALVDLAERDGLAVVSRVSGAGHDGRVPSSQDRGLASSQA